MGSIFWFRDTLFEINSGSRQVRFGIDLGAPSPRFAYHFVQKWDNAAPAPTRKTRTFFIDLGVDFGTHVCTTFTSTQSHIQQLIFLFSPEARRSTTKHRLKDLHIYLVPFRRYQLVTHYTKTTTLRPHQYHITTTISTSKGIGLS